MLDAGEENSKCLSRLISRETFTTAPRKESAVGLTEAYIPGDTSLSSVVMSEAELSSFPSCPLGRASVCTV